MNKVYRIVWNASLGTWVVASELVKSKKKATLSVVTGITTALMITFSPNAFADRDADDKAGTAINIGGTYKTNPNKNYAASATENSGNLVSFENPYVTRRGPDYVSGAIAVGNNATAKAPASIALGDHALVDYTAQNGGIAVGPYAYSKLGGSAIGINSESQGAYAVAMGRESTAVGGYSVALGILSQAVGNSSVAIGDEAVAKGAAGIAQGGDSKASGDYSVAQGYTAAASGANAIAQGNNAQAVGDYSTAQGYNAAANGVSAMAFGQEAKAPGIRTIAMGKGASTDSKKDTQNAESIAIGAYTDVSGDQSVGIGANVVASGNSSVAIGGDDVNKVIDSNGSDYTNLTGQKLEKNVYIPTTASGSGSTASGVQAKAEGAFSSAYGLASKSSGLASLALGTYSNSSGRGSLAMGPVSNATKDGSVAIGINTNSTGKNSVAMGAGETANTGAAASGDNTIALGTASKATPTSSVAIGDTSVVNDKSLRATAVGNKTTVGTNATDATALGSNASVGENATSSIAIGNSAKVVAQADSTNNKGQKRAVANSIAMGTRATALTNNTMAIGTDANAAGVGAIAFGVNADTRPAKDQENRESVAIGRSTKASGDQSVALGANSISSGDSSVAIGGDDIDKVVDSDGQTYTDITGGKLIKGNDTANGGAYTATQSAGAGATAVGVQSTAGGAFATALGLTSSASGAASVALGVSSDAAGKGALAIGPVSKASEEGAVAVGINSKSSGKNAVAIGSGETADTGSNATGENAIAIGNKAKALAKQSISIGTQNTVNGENSGAIGDPTTVNGKDSYSLGNNNTIDTDSTFVVGNNVTQTTKGSVALGEGSAVYADGGVQGFAQKQASDSDKSRINATKSTTGAVSVGDAKNGVFRQITGVAAGKEDSDAVNVAQLAALDNKVDQGITVQTNGGNAGAVKPGDTLDIGTVSGEKNLNVTKNGNTIQYGLNRNLDVDSVTAGNTKMDNSGVTIANGPSMTSNGIDGGNKQIKNVASAGDITNANNAKNAVNAGDVNNALTDLKEKGFSVSAQGGSKDTIELTENVDYRNGDGNLTVTNPSNNTIQFNLSKDINLGEGGSLTVGNSKVSNKGFTVSNGPSMTTDGIDAAKKKVTNVANGDISSTSKDAINGSQVYNISNSVKDAIGGDTVVNPDGTVTPSNLGGTGANNINDAIGAVNDKANKGLNFAANSGKVVNKQLGETLTVKGEGTKEDTEYSAENLKTKTDDEGNIVVMQDKNSKFESVTADDGKGNSTVLNTAGTTVKDQDGNEANYGAKQAKHADKDGNSTVTNAAGTTVTNPDGNKTTVGADKVTVGDGANPVVVNGKDGYVTGLQNQTWDPNNIDPSRAATEGQMKQATSDLSNKGLNFAGNSGDVVHKNLGETLTIKGDGTKEDTEYSAENVKTKTDQDGNVVVMQDKNSKFESVTADDGKGNSTVLNTAGTTVKDQDGNEANYGAKQAKHADKDGNSTVTNATGTTVTNPDGNKTTVGADKVTVGDGANPVVVNGKDGVVTGLTNTTWNPNDVVPDRAATEGQVQQATSNLDDKLTNKGLNFTANSGKVVHKNLGETLTVKGEGTKADTEYSAENLKTKTDDEGNIVIMQDKNSKFESVTADDGKGNSTVLNTAGTTVKDQDGNEANYGAKKAQLKDKAGNNTTTTAEGTTVTNPDGNSTTVGADKVTVGDGANPVVVNGKDGVVTGLTNQTWDPNNIDPSRAATEGQMKEATDGLANKGLNFVGNSGDVVHKNLGETLTIKGDGTKEDTEYSAENVKTKTDKDGNVVVMQDKNSKFESVTADDGKGNSTVLNTAGTTVKDQDGNEANYGAKQAKHADKDGNSTVTNAVGTTVTNADGNKTTVGADKVTVGDGANPVVVNGKDGVVTGLTNQTWDPNNIDPSRAATEGQMKEATDGLANKGLNFVGNSGDVVHKNLGETLTIKGDGTKEDTEYSAENVKTKTDKDGNVIVMQDKNSKFESVTADDGKGNSTVLNTAGTTVKDQDGNEANYGAKQAKHADKDGNSTVTNAAGTTVTNADGNKTTVGADKVTVGDGANPVVVNGKDGVVTGLTNQTWDPNNIDPSRAATEGQMKQATSDLSNKGLNFAGNSGDVVHKNLGETLTIKGDGTKEDTEYNAENVKTKTDKDGNVVVSLDKNSKFDSINAGGTLLDNNGVSFVDQAGKPVDNTPSITKAGLNAGNQKITNVAPGTISPDSTDAVNGSQLSDLADNAVKYDKNADGTPNYDKISAGNGKGTPAQTGKDDKGNDVVTSGGTSISNVANGVNPDDAVNKGQLDKVAQAGNEKNDNLGNTTANNLGGGAKYDPATGKVSSPTYTVNGKDANNVGDAIAELDKGFTLASNGQESKAVKAGDTVDIGTADGEKNLVVSKKDNTIQYSMKRDLDVDSINAGGTKLDKDGVSFVGQDGNPVANTPSIKKSGIDAGNQKITNVADGTVAKDSKDAVNGGQLSQLADNAVQYDKNDDGTPNYDKISAGNGKGTPVKTGKDNRGNDIVTEGGTTITNVANGVNPADAVNKGQLDSAISNNVTNVTDGDGNKVNITDQIVNPNYNNGNKADSLFLTYDKNGQETTDRLTIGQTVQKMNTEGVKFAHTNGSASEKGTKGTTNDSSAGADHSTAMGVNAIVEDQAESAIALGHNTLANDTATNAVVIGKDSQVTGASSVAIGHGAQAVGEQSISVGTGNVVTGNHAGAFGDPSTVSGNNSYVLGNNNTVSTDNTFVVGNDVTKTTKGSVVLGQSSAATTAEGVQGYSLEKASDADRKAIAATTSTTGAVAVGDADNNIFRQITGVAAGTQNSDAVNVAQLKAVDNKIDLGSQAIANIFGGGSAVNPDGSVSNPTYNVGGGTQNNVADALKALDDAAKNNGTAATQAKTKVTQGDNVVVTESKNADGSSTYNVATAQDMKVNSINAGGTKLDNNGLTFVDDSGNPVANTPSIKKSGIDAGNQKITNVADGTVAAGSKDAVNGGQLANVASQVNNLNQGKAGLVQQTNPSAEVTVAKDTGGKTVNFTGTEGDRQLTGVAAGQVAEGSTDAVNGGQIAKISNSTANAIGGNTVVNPDGTISTSNVGGTGKDNINDAIASVNANATKAKTTVSGDKNVVVNASQNADGSTNYGVALNPDLDVNSVKAGGVTLGNGGINAGNQKVAGVADGAIAKDSKDAVNGAQIHQGNTNVANYLGGGAAVGADGQVTAPTYNVAGGKYNNVGDALTAVDGRMAGVENKVDQNFAFTNNRINKLEDKLSSGIAATAALENAPYVPGKWTYAAGASYYNTQGAIGATLRRTADNGRWSMTGGVAGGTNGSPLVRVGISGVIN